MELIFASYWFYAVLGAIVGFSAVRSRMFAEGAGLVLFVGALAALVVAAVLGALSPVLPAIVGGITGRAALLCVCFVGAVWFGDRSK
jgi:hypothetical protein